MSNTEREQLDLLRRYKHAYENLLPKVMIKVMKEWTERFPHLPFRQTYNRRIIHGEEDKKEDRNEYWDDLDR